MIVNFNFKKNQIISENDSNLYYNNLLYSYDGEYIGEIENHYYKMQELENRNSVMKKESEINLTKKNIINIFPQLITHGKNMMLKH